MLASSCCSYVDEIFFRTNSRVEVPLTVTKGDEEGAENNKDKDNSHNRKDGQKDD